MAQIRPKAVVPQAVLQEIPNGYRVTFSSYTTEVLIYHMEKVPGLSIRADTSSDGVPKATVLGVLSQDGETADFDTAFAKKGVPKGEGLAAIVVALISIEEALKRRGVKAIVGSTHPAFLRFLEPMGYYKTGDADVDETGGNTRFRKDLTPDAGINLPRVLELFELRKHRSKHNP